MSGVLHVGVVIATVILIARAGAPELAAAFAVVALGLLAATAAAR